MVASEVPVRGKEKRLSLGVYPDVALKDARQRRDEARKLIANGVDPSEHRKAQKATSRENGANSFEVIAREWFDKHSANWVASHADRIIRLPGEHEGDRAVTGHLQ